MPGRPRIERKIEKPFRSDIYMPARNCGEVQLEQDELEALRLADHECLYMENAAACMGVSRATFCRILERGRKKVVGALLNSECIRI